MMLRTTLAVAFSSFFALSYATPLLMKLGVHKSLAARDGYITFGGDGSMDAGWPKQSEWMSFKDAWNANLNMIQNACKNNKYGDNNSDAETQAIRSSIVSEALESKIPEAFILAIMMQESKGCVRAPTSHSDAPNPGLMQGAGTASCEATTPCPSAKIRAMIHEGVAGEDLTTSLKSTLVFFAKTTDDSKWYKAARRYNAGSQVTDRNLGHSTTNCYASDIANRLLHPFEKSGCDDDVVATLTATEGRAGNQDADADDESAIPLKQKQVLHNDDEDDDQDQDVEGIEDQDVTGAVEGCTRFYTPVRGNTCGAAPVDFETLRRLNEKLNGECGNLWAGYKYCVAAN